MNSEKTSNQTKEPENTSALENDETTETSSQTTENENTEVPNAEEKFNELNDRYMRMYSEFENFRRRTAKEKLELISNASSNVLSDILPIIDDFERAIKNNTEVDDASAIKEGIELIHSKLFNILKSKGLNEMEAQDKPFDSDFHEAVTKIPAPSKNLKGKVVDVIEKGYLLNDKVLRYAKVVVGE